MAQLGKLHWTVTNTSGTVQNVQVYVLKQGATCNGTQNATTLNVHHIGALASGKQVRLWDGSALGSLLTLTGVTATTVTFAAAVSVTDGDRFLLVDATTYPSLYSDSAGGDAVSQPVTTGTDGTLEVWLQNQPVDIYDDTNDLLLAADAHPSGHEIILSNVYDSATGDAFIIDTTRALSTAGMGLLSLRNATVEKLVVGYDGSLAAANATLTGALTAGTSVTAVSGTFDTNLWVINGSTNTVSMATGTLDLDPTTATIGTGSLTLQSNLTYKVQCREQLEHQLRICNSSGNLRAFTDGDTTPSVGSGSSFKTANTGGTTITMFDDGVEGQVIFVLFNDGNTTIDFTGTNLKGNVGADFTGAQYDSMVCFFDGTNWICDVSDNTA